MLVDKKQALVFSVNFRAGVSVKPKTDVLEVGCRFE